ncbi:hypothetical protein L195_g049169, partial [Trifolium pratense]
RSYEELLKKFNEKEEELRVANFKLHNSEAQLDNVCEELKLKEEELNKQKELSEEEIFKLKTQIEESEIQLKVTQESMDKLEFELVSELEANETNNEQEVQKLKSEMLDSKAKFSLEKDKLHFDIAILSKRKTELTFKLEDCDSRNKELENKLKQYEAEKLNQLELHATQIVLQDEIISLRQELQQRMDDAEATNKKLDMVMIKLDEANVMIANSKAEICSRDGKISKMKKYTDDVKTSLKELMDDYNTALNEVNNLKPRVGELENEVTRQNGVISDMAMGNKEALRQVHEHYESKLEIYKTAYNELLQKSY